ncbi:MAG TPA: alpha-glucosidase [Candidatus Treponema faecavium]|nr:alpha-glucosidase [Candidatus Treponema faecavium]
MEHRAWWKEGVIYQIYPRSFMDSNGDGIGDINGIRQKLPYLKDLGIDIIWLSPFYTSPQVDNGYDISDYQGIDPMFGTMTDFDALLAEAHALHIKIVIDLVVNHTSDQHPWFIESRKSTDNPYRDFYIWRDPKPDGSAPNNWGSCFSGSAWQYDKHTRQYYLHLFAPQQPDLNWDNPNVRDAVFDMMDWWCRKGIDGFRMDVISMISKAPGLPDGPKEPGAIYGNYGPYVVHGPHVHDYLMEMNRRVLSRYDLVTVGETSGVTTEQAKQYAGFDTHELNMVFQFERTDCESENGSKWTDKRISLPELKAVFSRWQTELEGKAWNSLYWENHDQPRSVSRYGSEGAYWKESAKMLALCLHMQKGTPYVYQGEELGMTNRHITSLDECRDVESINAYHEMTEKQGVHHEDMLRYINRIGRDNARTPFQWSDEAQAGFTTGTPWIAVNPNYTRINAAAQVSDPDSVFSFYKTLIALRKQYPVIPYGQYELLEKDHKELYVYTRTLADAPNGPKQLLIICNFSEQAVPYALPQQFSGAGLLIANYADTAQTAQAEQCFRPYEAAVYMH